jgi:hypothetical protein
MTHRASSIIAWSILALSGAVAAGGALLATSDLATAFESGGLTFSIPSLAFCAVGAVVAARLPRNPVGWLILAFGFSSVLSLLAEEYARFGLSRGTMLPGSEIVLGALAVFADWAPPGFLALAFLFYPDGRLPSRRWRSVAWAVVIACGVSCIVGAFTPGAVLGIRGTRNPLADAELADGLAPLLSLASVLLVGIFILCAASLVIRFRRSHGVERQQIKLFAFSASMIAAFLLMGNALEAFAGGADDGLGDRIAIIVFPIVLSGIPLAVGVAILRYRLYDIDRIISRTLAYGVLTAVLAGGYLLAVLALQSLLPVSEDSPLVVAISTLGVVAAFGPLRVRVQRAMDHRFNRSRYDAERVIAEFGGRLRSEVQLESINRDLVHVVRSTIHPDHVSLWFREGGTSSG